jgi:hypothetical protein
MLVLKAAAFVSVVYACLMTRLRATRSSRPRISYAPNECNGLGKAGQPELNI